MWREIVKALKKMFGVEEAGCIIDGVKFFENLYCYKTLYINGALYIFGRLVVVRP